MENDTPVTLDLKKGVGVLKQKPRASGHEQTPVYGRKEAVSFATSASCPKISSISETLTSCHGGVSVYCTASAF